MKMKKRLGVAAVAALVLAAGTVTAFAEGTGPHARDGRGLGRLGESLGLSDEQQATWKSLHEQHKAEMEPLRQEGRDLRMRLRTAMEAREPRSGGSGGGGPGAEAAPREGQGLTRRASEPARRGVERPAEGQVRRHPSGSPGRLRPLGRLQSQDPSRARVLITSSPAKWGIRSLPWLACSGGRGSGTMVRSRERPRLRGRSCFAT